MYILWRNNIYMFCFCLQINILKHNLQKSMSSTAHKRHIVRLSALINLLNVSFDEQESMQCQNAQLSPNYVENVFGSSCPTLFLCYVRFIGKISVCRVSWPCCASCSSHWCSAHWFAVSLWQHLQWLPCCPCHPCQFCSLVALNANYTIN